MKNNRIIDALAIIGAVSLVNYLMKRRINQKEEDLQKESEESEHTIISSSEETYCLKKKTTAEFLRYELIASLIQLSVILLSIIFATCNLTNSELLNKIAELKINDEVIHELGLTLLIVPMLAGFVAFVQKGLKPGSFNHILHEIYHELPKNIYFFGNSITAIMLAIGLYLRKAQGNEADHKLMIWYFIYAILTWILTYCYGAFCNWWINKEERIVKRKNILQNQLPQTASNITT